MGMKTNEQETVIQKVITACTPAPARLRRISWTKLGVWIGGISAFWMTIQMVVPDHVAHIIGTGLLAVSNFVMFMMKAEKPYPKVGDTRNNIPGVG